MQQKVLDGRYELERKIGEGGMARVYVARDMRLNRRVAVKIPHQRFVGDPDFLSRFRHEAQAAAMLSHPNIVDVYDVGQDGDIHYIVMEYVEGTDLKTLIMREAPLPIETVVAIGEQIALGLQAAHRAGMVHRDIKPQNVIVTPDGQAHISDFGVAKSHLSTALTETGVSFGTVDYLSPEQAQGRPALPQSDIYALGVVLYEMLTGRLPFSGDNAVAVAMKHVTEEPLPPRRLNPHIPPGLESLVLRAMAKDPARRPASALEFAQLLRGYDRLAQQDTVVNSGLGPRPAPAPQPRLGSAPPPQPRPAPPQPRPTAGGTTGRVSMPAPRTAPARAPRQEGLGCGVFLVGMLVLAGVLGIVVLLNSGALNGLFSGLFTGGGPARATAVVLPTAEPTPTGEPSPTPDERVAVPDLSGLSGPLADSTLRTIQLIPVRRDASDATVPAGQVVSQEVPPGSLLLPGEPVTYTVSLGPQLVTVPQVEGAQLSFARQQLEGLGLAVVVDEQPSRTVTAGFVISQSPAPGLRLPAGETVRIVVSVGDVIRFPDVIGLDRAEAETILSSTPGLELVFVDVQGSDRLPNFDAYRPNEVVSAQIENGPGLNNGDRIPRGSRVILGVREP